MKLKVLSVKKIPTFLRESYFEEFEEIAPVFNRNGRYFDRESGRCWLEYEGKAYLMDGKSFLHDLKMLSHIPLTDLEVVSLQRVISRGGFNTKQLRALYSTDQNWRMLRGVIRRAKMDRRRLFGR